MSKLCICAEYLDFFKIFRSSFQYLENEPLILQTIKVTFLILHHFPVVVLPLCLPVVTPRCGALRLFAFQGGSARGLGAEVHHNGVLQR